MSYALLLADIAKMMCTHRIEKNDTFNPLNESDESVNLYSLCTYSLISLLSLLIRQWTAKAPNTYS